MNQDDMKRAASVRAADYVESGMALGLGTGTTATYLIREIAARLADGRLRDLTCVPTSLRSAEFAASLGIAVTDLNDRPSVDLTIDGADEIDPQLNLIKGGGGALLREKLVAMASRRLIIVADVSKRVERLGTKAELPVEVIPFGWKTHLPYLQALGAIPTIRTKEDGSFFVTDGGHFILDCRFHQGIDDPFALQERLQARAGLVTSGLFLGMTERAVIANPTGIEEVVGSVTG